MKLILETIVENIGTRSDGTLKFTLGTQELDSSTVGNLFHFRGKFIKCLLSDSNVTTIEEELIDTAVLVGGKKPKSESSRLRSVLFRLHEQMNPEIEFEIFYKQEMNKIIEHFKSKLD